MKDALLSLLTGLIVVVGLIVAMVSFAWLVVHPLFGGIALVLAVAWMLGYAMRHADD